jgi:hypothetical protein
MGRLVLTDAVRKRISKWILNSNPITPNSVWTEHRLAIDIGGATHIISNGQIYQCGKCGHYDPEWSATEVLTYFEELMGIKPYEITVACTVATEVIDNV